MLDLIDDKLHCKSNTEKSHADWFIKEGWIIRDKQGGYRMYVWYLDEDTGIYAGINDDGKLFIGDMHSWDIMEDTVRNRQYIEDCFIKYTGKSLDYGSRWKDRIQDKLNNTDGKIKIGIGHMISAMVRYNFGHEEINAMKIAMETGDFSGIYFCKDC